MTGRPLEGRAILVVEDEPFIALYVTECLEEAGATVTSTASLKQALILAEHDGLAGAILDHGLPDGDSGQLASRLKDRGVPFLIFSGYAALKGPYGDAVHLAKPAGQDEIVSAMQKLIRSSDK